MNGQCAHENMLNIISHQGNTNQDHDEVLIMLDTPLEWLRSKRQIINVTEDGENLEPSYTSGGSAK